MSIDAKYYNAFNLIGEIGPMRFKKLSRYFGDLKNAWTAGKPEIFKSGLEEAIADKIIEARTKISPDREWEKLDKEKITTITINDKDYPKLLKETYDPPAILYIKGQLSGSLDFPLAVVGSRKMSSYGKQAITDIVGGLARSGLSIVSGMSYGIDMAAHETAISNGAKTVAVLASGLDAYNLSPRKQIAEKIIAHGALISEYPLGMPACKWHFPVRNRVVAGLALGVLVVEAAEKSGSLITPRLALEANRDVFAIPGGIYWPNSLGTNHLIKQGAKAITSYQEILEELNLTKIADYTNNKRIVPDSPEEEAVCSLLSAEPLHIDAVAKKAKMDASKIGGILMLMEMKGLVKNLGGGNYTILR